MFHIVVSICFGVAFLCGALFGSSAVAFQLSSVFTRGSIAEVIGRAMLKAFIICVIPIGILMASDCMLKFLQ
jgi:hypothetical protein